MCWSFGVYSDPFGSVLNIVLGRYGVQGHLVCALYPCGSVLHIVLGGYVARLSRAVNSSFLITPMETTVLCTKTAMLCMLPRLPKSLRLSCSWCACCRCSVVMPPVWERQSELTDSELQRQSELTDSELQRQSELTDSELQRQSELTDSELQRQSELTDSELQRPSELTDSELCKRCSGSAGCGLCTAWRQSPAVILVTDCSWAKGSDLLQHGCCCSHWRCWCRQMSSVWMTCLPVVSLCCEQEQKYLCSFEDNSDYVSDVQWSPTNPALFSSADIMGRLDLWHLNHETEVSHPVFLFSSTPLHLPVCTISVNLGCMLCGGVVLFFHHHWTLVKNLTLVKRGV